MRALSLDYRRGSTPIQHWVGVIVLLLALAAAVQIAVYYRQVAAQSGQLEALVAKIERKLHPGLAAQPTPTEAQQLGAEIKDANEVMLRLGLPWDDMFAAVEQANSDSIALLGIEPDVQKGLLRVSGEAKDFHALFGYVRLLQQDESLSAIYLKHHQIKEQDPERPIRFILDASWKAKH